MKTLFLAIAILFGQRSGYVIEKTFEGGQHENDLYIVEFTDGHRAQLEADDLEQGDFVNVYFLFGQPSFVKYIDR